MSPLDSTALTLARRGREPRRPRSPRSPQAGGRGRASWKRLLPFLAVTLVAFLGYRAWHGRQLLQGVHALGRLQDAATAHDRIDAYFNDFPRALARGALELQEEDTTLLLARLRVLRWCLLDDYLLEMPAHRRPDLRDDSRPRVFSLHGWIASEDSRAWRESLLDLTEHANREVAALAVEIVSRIATKIPESLAQTPLPPCGRAELRDFLRALDPATRDPGDLAAIAPFVLESLRAHGHVSLWHDSEPAADSTLALCLELLRADPPRWLVETRAALLLALEGAMSESLWPSWVEALAATDTAAARSRLVDIARDRNRFRRERALALELASRPGDSRFRAELAGSITDPAGRKLVASMREAVARDSGEVAGDAPVSAALTVEDLERLAHRARPLDYGRGQGAHVLESWRGAADSALAERIGGATLAVIEGCAPRSGVNELAETLASLARTSSLDVAHRAGVQLWNIGFEPTSPGLAGVSWSDELDVWPVEAALERESTRWVDSIGSSDPLVRFVRLLADDDPRRRHAAARTLGQLLEADSVAAEAYRAHRDELMRRHDECETPTRLVLIEIFSRREEGDAFGDWARRHFRGAYERRAPTVAIAVLQALESRVLRDARSAGESESQAQDRVLVELFLRLAQSPVEAPELTWAYRYLRRRFSPTELDAAIASWLPSVTGTTRGRLVRFFPAHPTPARIRTLVSLLTDQSATCRFWALRKLEVLADGEDFDFDPARPAHSDTNRPALQRWQSWLQDRER